MSPTPPPTERVEVELHSTDPGAVDAAERTILALGGILEQEDGRFYLCGGLRPLDYIVWAALRQGYVKGRK